MEIYTVSQLRENIYNIIDEVAESHAEIYITGKRNNAVIISEEDYRAIKETLYLLSVPGMRESIIAGSKEPITKCSKDLNW